MKVELHPEADTEFVTQVEYYEGKEKGLGVRFYHEVISSFEWLAKNPSLPRLRKGHRRLNLKVFPFYIAYVIEGEVIWVLAVAHNQKRPTYWITRRKS